MRCHLEKLPWNPENAVGEIHPRTIVGFLLMHHFLNAPEEDSQILDLGFGI
jgi:hypothetical protein